MMPNSSRNGLCVMSGEFFIVISFAVLGWYISWMWRFLHSFAKAIFWVALKMVFSALRNSEMEMDRSNDCLCLFLAMVMRRLPVEVAVHWFVAW